MGTKELLLTRLRNTQALINANNDIIQRKEVEFKELHKKTGVEKDLLRRHLYFTNYVIRDQLKAQLKSIGKELSVYCYIDLRRNQDRLHQIFGAKIAEKIKATEKAIDDLRGITEIDKQALKCSHLFHFYLIFDHLTE